MPYQAPRSMRGVDLPRRITQFVNRYPDLEEVFIAIDQDFREILNLIQNEQDKPGSPFLSVMDKGAKGNGAFDDTDAIQAALDANLFVWFPEPDTNYRITAPLKFRDGQVLFGAGAKAAVIK